MYDTGFGGFFRELFIMFPLLLMFAAGAVIAVLRWGRAPKASMWTLLAFGLALLLCLIVPVGQRIAGRLFMGADYRFQQVIFFALAFFWSVLRALPYLFLLIAVYSGRKPDTAAPPASA